MSKEDTAVLQETVQNPETYRLTVLRPGGNDTCLIAGIVEDAATRKRVNDAVMESYPTVEQVGFVDLDPALPKLMMAGGEFCGNATRSTAWLALGGQPGELLVQVSGVSKLLRAGVTDKKEAFAEMPIYSDLAKITEDPEVPGNYVVKMEGITQYIAFDTEVISGLTPDEIKITAKKRIDENDLGRFPAAGVIYSQKNGDGWRITPVVFVPGASDEGTLFLETACGSGTTALGMVLAMQQGASIKDVPIMQPSGLAIAVSVEFDGQSFQQAQISGPLEIVVPMALLRLPLSTGKEEI